MRKSLTGALSVLTVLAMSGCALISATGEYYVVNGSSEEIRVTWDATHKALPGGPVFIEAGATGKLTTQRLLEADEVPPSECFTWITISVPDGHSWREVYVQDPIIDSLWPRADAGIRRHSYTLTITDDHL